MNKILQLSIEDFENQKSSAEYQLIHQKVCKAETACMNMINKEQKKDYLTYDFIESELRVQEFNEFAIFLFENFKENF